MPWCVGPVVDPENQNLWWWDPRSVSPGDSKVQQGLEVTRQCFFYLKSDKYLHLIESSTSWSKPFSNSPREEMSLYTAKPTAKVTFSPSPCSYSKFYAFKYISVTILFMPPNPVPLLAHQSTLAEYRFRELGKMPHYLIKTCTRRSLWSHLCAVIIHGNPYTSCPHSCVIARSQMVTDRCNSCYSLSVW